MRESLKNHDDCFLWLIDIAYYKPVITFNFYFGIWISKSHTFLDPSTLLFEESHDLKFTFIRVTFFPLLANQNFDLFSQWLLFASLDNRDANAASHNEG